MSILIKGMEMPTSCKECHLLQDMDECYWCGCNSYLVFGDKEFVPDYVMNGCPLVPVPPHGRLIDADELKKFPIRRDHYDKEHGDEHFINGIEIVMEFIDYALTIIEAEEGE